MQRCMQICQFRHAGWLQIVARYNQSGCQNSHHHHLHLFVVTVTRQTRFISSPENVLRQIGPASGAMPDAPATRSNLSGGIFSDGPLSQFLLSDMNEGSVCFQAECLTSVVNKDSEKLSLHLHTLLILMPLWLAAESSFFYPPLFSNAFIALTDTTCSRMYVMVLWF